MYSHEQWQRQGSEPTEMTLSNSNSQALRVGLLHRRHGADFHGLGKQPALPATCNASENLEPLFSRSSTPSTTASSRVESEILFSTYSGTSASSYNAVGTRLSEPQSRPRNDSSCNDESESVSSRDWNDSGSLNGAQGATPSVPSDTRREETDPGNTTSRTTKSTAVPDTYISDTCHESDKDEDEENGDSDEEEDNEWSGERDPIEVGVLGCIQDLGLASYMIMKMSEDNTKDNTQKIKGWQVGIRGCATRSEGSSSDSKAQTGGLNTYRQTKSHKRQRRSASGGGNSEDDDRDDDDDEDDDQLPLGPRDGTSNGRPILYACPLFKGDADRYCMDPKTKVHYSVCMGEQGFKSIQRVREHLKRKHTPVQCSRCFEQFTGTGAQTKLKEHQRNTPCVLKDPKLKVGIDEEQWAKLDAQAKKRKRHISNVDKWMQIFDVVCPGCERPDHPWPERMTTVAQPTQYKDFERMFTYMYDYQTKEGMITPHPDLKIDEMNKQRIIATVKSTLDLNLSIHGEPSLTTDTTDTSTRTQQRVLPDAPDTPDGNMNVYDLRDRDHKTSHLAEKGKDLAPMPRLIPNTGLQPVTMSVDQASQALGMQSQIPPTTLTMLPKSMSDLDYQFGSDPSWQFNTYGSWAPSIDPYPMNFYNESMQTGEGYDELQCVADVSSHGMGMQDQGTQTR